MRFGIHVSIAGGVEKAVERAVALGCDCCQIFVANPRSWSDKRVEPEAAARFRAARRQAGLMPVVVHQTYLPNLASPNPEDWERSRQAFLAQYADAALLGADLYVLHPGSAKGGSRKRAAQRVARALRQGLSRIKHGPLLLLENTAGGGSQLGSTPDGLALVAKALDAPERVGVCFDTAHAHAAGQDMSAPGTMRVLRERFRRAFGYPPIRLVHLNDLRGPCGTAHDRHQHIGRGSIGTQGMTHILHTPGMRRAPFILETPVEQDGDDARNLATARRLGATDSGRLA